MPELILEIGGRVFEVACEPGEEFSLERAGRLLDTEAVRIGDAGRQTEKRMLLLAGLMLADTMTGVQEQLRAAEERVRHAEERTRIAEAKSAMLAANALKLETEASHKTSPDRDRRPPRGERGRRHAARPGGQRDQRTGGRCRGVTNPTSGLR